MTELTHLGFIVDGNRRWARERGLPTLEGHRRGFKKVEALIKEIAKAKIPYASFYLFSTENWNRSKEEVSYLMKLIDERLDTLTKECQKLSLKCLILGRPEPVEPDLWAKLKAAEQSTAFGQNGTICLCFNYGGQQEIVDAVNQILSERSAGASSGSREPSAVSSSEPPEPSAELSSDATPVNSPKDLTTADFARYLYHPEVPPCDLIVRTSGEQRISGFMLWRAAYSEFLFLDQYFPDLDPPADLPKILEEYSRRSRRYGR